MPDPEVEHNDHKNKTKEHKKSPAKRIKIIFKNGKTIQETTAAETLMEFIKIIGIERVRGLGIKQCKIPLISNTIDKKYKSKQKPLGNGWFLMTNTSTETKKHDILRIAEAFKTPIEVEII